MIQLVEYFLQHSIIFSVTQQLFSKYSRKSCLTLVRPEGANIPLMQKLFLPQSIGCPKSPTGNEKFKLVYAMQSDDKEPISDIGLASKIQIANITSHKEDLKLKSLPLLPDVAAANFEDAFRKKLKLCRKLCNFSSPNYDIEAKNIKTLTLKEIFTLLQSAKNVRTFSDQLQKRIIDMCMKNIYRKIPTVNGIFLYYEEIPSFIDPCWVHLYYVYNILKRMIHIVSHNEYFSLEWIKRFISLLKTPFQPEREEIVQIIIEYIRNHEDNIDEIISFILYLIAEHRESDACKHPYMLSSCLDAIFGINFLQDYLSRYYVSNFHFLLIPMISDPHFLCFANNMEKVVDDFLSHYPNQGKDLIVTIIRYFPINGGNRQVAALKMILKIFPYLTASNFTPPIRRSLECFGEAVSSYSVNVARFALFALTDNVFIPIFKDHPKKIFPILVPRIRTAKALHWSHKVRDAASCCMQHLQKLDSKYSKEMNPVLNEETFGHMRLHTWVGITRLAAQNDCSINLGLKLSEMSLLFKMQSSSNNMMSIARRSSACVVRVPMNKHKRQVISVKKF